jgi:hypothetical protein
MPASSAPHVIVPTSPPAPQPEDKDAQFLALLADYGIHPPNRNLAINGAHTICNDLAEGASKDEIISGIVAASTTGIDHAHAMYVAGHRGQRVLPTTACKHTARRASPSARTVQRHCAAGEHDLRLAA